MSEEQTTHQLIVDTAVKIFTDHCDKPLLDRAEKGEFPDALWQQITENGFDQLGSVSSGTSVQDMFAFVQQCGRFAVPMPIADTLLVNRWCESESAAATATSGGLYAIGLVDGGEVIEVPWGRRADKVLAVQQGSHEVRVIENPEVIKLDTNLAGEPRDSVVCPADAEVLHVAVDPYAQLAVARINLMAGSLQALLDLGLQFANEREQFGRAIAKFQAIQHSLAVVAGEVAVSRRAADAAVDAMDTERFLFEVAASKARVGEAVTIVAERVHQVHGAMGFTHEHRLHHFSRRAWAWRDEYGNEFYWQTLLGAHLAKLGPDRLWPFIATRD